MEDFDYLNPNISVAFNEKLAGRSRDAFEKEVKERARLLYNLKFGKKEAVDRIQRNIAWEFDSTWTSRLPDAHKLVKKIVGAVYSGMAGKKD
jgi:hypothetical protein